jgi:hypothetical protein
MISRLVANTSVHLFENLGWWEGGPITCCYIYCPLLPFKSEGGVVISLAFHKIVNHYLNIRFRLKMKNILHSRKCKILDCGRTKGENKIFCALKK